MKAKKKVWPRKAERYLIPIYGQQLYFCPDPETFKACWRYVTDDPEPVVRGGRATQLTERNGSMLYLIYAPTAGVLAHECAHVCFWLLYDVGIGIEEGGKNEAFCYLLHDIYAKFAPMVKK